MKLVVRVDSLYSPLTGVGQYTHNLLKILLQSKCFESIAGVGDLALLNEGEVIDLLGRSDQGLIARPNPVIDSAAARYEALRSVVRRIPYSRWLRDVVRGLVVRLLQHRIKDAIYWEPGYTLLPISNRAVTTVYDLSHVRYPEFHPVERVRLLEQQLRQSIQRSQQVITISEFSKQEIMEVYGLPESKIAIVPPAVDDSFRAYKADETRDVRQRYNLPPKFILSLATMEPRKNISGLLDAYLMLPDQLRRRFPLVLVGKRGWCEAEILKKIQQIPTGQLIELGYVPQSDLPKLLSSAVVMAYPSFYEGFGMPVLEAMASGVAVLTSATSAIPELVGDAALLVDPFDTNSIAEGLAALLQDDAFRRRLVCNGLLRAKSYDWNTSAQQLLAVIRQVAEQ